MKPVFRLPILLLSIPLLLTTSCSDEAQLAEQCETQSSCETTTETKTNWASAGGIGAGVVVLGALAGGGGGSGGGGSSSSSNTDTTDSSNNNPGSTPTTPTLIGRFRKVNSNTHTQKYSLISLISSYNFFIIKV